jgi:hypothetical protein
VCKPINDYNEIGLLAKYSASALNASSEKVDIISAEYFSSDLKQSLAATSSPSASGTTLDKSPPSTPPPPPPPGENDNENNNDATSNGSDHSDGSDDDEILSKEVNSEGGRRGRGGNKKKEESKRVKNSRVAFSIWLGILIDGVPESMLIGFMQSEGDMSFAFIVAVFLANFPEAMSAASLM